MPIRVGLIGCGTIGGIIARALDQGKVGKAHLIIIYDKNIERAQRLCSSLKKPPKIAENINQLIENSDVDIVVEAASQEAVKEYAVKILKAEKDLMILSVGALIDLRLLKEILHVAKEKNAKVYIPSGAIAGLDGVKAAALDQIEKVTLITRKPPKALEGGSPSKAVGEKVAKPTVIYEGPAQEACRLFPANVNVAAALSLAGIGAEKTIVRIVADPSLDRNVHEVEVKGAFGELRVCVHNVPSPDNPKTSYLAALSAIATLKKITEPLVIGT